MLGLTLSIHTFWKMIPKVTVMMATVCLRLCPVCMIPRVMTSPFKCKATLHVDVCMLLNSFSLCIFLAMILVASQMTSRPKFKL